jgi:hypothetical protein
MSGFGSGVRRGVMAGDQFTQIANGPFRDNRISYRVKGLFGYISTHRDGWQITAANLARHGREHVDAVTTGLKELEHHGFLLRERDRNADGTLGQVLYFITDLPAWQSPSSQPESGFQGLAEPVLADPGTKNTIAKKTNQQKTKPLRPCDRGDAARTNARMAPSMGLADRSSCASLPGSASTCWGRTPPGAHRASARTRPTSPPVNALLVRLTDQGRPDLKRISRPGDADLAHARAAMGPFSAASWPIRPVVATRPARHPPKGTPTNDPARP